MPGPVSDSYDPEWSTGDNRASIDEALDHVYGKLTGILKGKPPVYILDLVNDCREEGMGNNQLPAILGENEWRLLRFAVERARDSL